MKKTGFTLIELLIVIALLGALAVGLLATIDPFEQLKKGRDTSTRNTLSEFYNANLRYYSTKSEFPWGPTGLGSSTPVSALATAVTALQNQGELKTNFLTLAGNSTTSIFVTSTSAEDIHVCYMPESKGFRGDPNTIYNISGGEATDCISQTSSGTACYYCVQ